MADLSTQIRDYFETTAPAVETVQAPPASVRRDRVPRLDRGLRVAVIAALAVGVVIGLPALLLLNRDGADVATQPSAPSSVSPATTLAAAPAVTSVPVVDGGAVVVEPPPPPLVLGSGVAFARSGDTLWAWDAEGGVAGYRDGAWRSLPPLPGSGLDVSGTLDTTVWALTRSRVPGPSVHSTLWYLEEGEWSQLSDARVLPTEMEDAEDVEVEETTGIVWLGDPNGVLHRWDGAEMISSGTPQLEMVLDRIAVTSDGTVWASRFNPSLPQLPAGLLRYYPDTGTWESIRPLGGDQNVPAVLTGTPSGNLWVLLANVSEWPREPLDSPGNMDFPSAWALAYLDTTAGEWTIYEAPEGHPGDMAADDDVVWLTVSPLVSGETMVYRFDREVWTVHSPGSTIDSLGIGDDGTLWASIHPTNIMNRLVIEEGTNP